MSEYADLPITEQVPKYYMNSPQSKAIIQATTNSALEAQAAIKDTAAQLWVHTATWGLAMWEELLDITPDASATVEARRSTIIAKMLGSGTCNSTMVRDVAKAITGYDCKVDERFAQYTFSLIFQGDEATFADVDRQAIIDAIELIKPAHLKFVIEPIMWQDLKNMGLTWGEVQKKIPSWGNFQTTIVIQKKEEQT